MHPTGEALEFAFDQRHCISDIVYNQIKIVAVFNLVSDFAILMIPMPPLWRLQMRLKRKLLTMGVLRLVCCEYSSFEIVQVETIPRWSQVGLQPNLTDDGWCIGLAWHPLCAPTIPGSLSIPWTWATFQSPWSSVTGSNFQLESLSAVFLLCPSSSIILVSKSPRPYNSHLKLRIRLGKNRKA